ncbi:hypothetical protein S83_048713 [Arachis hypogaea]
MDNQAKSSGASSFTSAMNLDQQGVSSIPQRYVLPPSQRPNIIHHDEHVLPLPIIDLSDFHDQVDIKLSTKSEMLARSLVSFRLLTMELINQHK